VVDSRVSKWEMMGMGKYKVHTTTPPPPSVGLSGTPTNRIGSCYPYMSSPVFVRENDPWALFMFFPPPLCTI